MQTIGERVKAHRRSQGWTQEDLSAASGISVATIQRTERGSAVSQDTMTGLAAAFNLRLIDLVDPDPREGQPYLPLRIISGGRDLIAILAAAERFDFAFAELEDLEQARLIERLQAFCDHRGPDRIPSGAVAQVEQEIEAKALLREMRVAKLLVSGATYSIDCAEIDDECGAGLGVLMAQWQERVGVLRVGTEAVMVDRAYVMDSLGDYETPVGGAVVFPEPPAPVDWSKIDEGAGGGG